jgi:hypothetical protein
MVVLETPGDAEGTGPEIAIASGCTETPVQLRGTVKGTRLSAIFTTCRSLGSPVRVRGKTDASCQTLTGTLKARRQKTRPFTATLAAGFDARVVGTVSAVQGTASILLPGATVYLKDHTTHARSPLGAVTDASGSFGLPPQAPGTYDVCAEAAGFVPACDPTPVELGPGSPDYKHRALQLPPAGGAIHGHVLLADGSACYRENPGYDAHLAATVRLGSRVVTANSSGEYVLTGLPGVGVYVVDAACAAAHAARSVEVGAGQLSGALPVDFRIANSAPTITLLSASDASGPLRTGMPGETVTVTVQATDPESDALHYAWRDGNDLVDSIDAPTIAWPLLGVEAANTLNVQVTDGKGGFAERQLVVGTSPTGDRFIGTVVDGATGAVLPGVQVDVDGVGATTDEAGAFRIAVTEGERHLLTVRDPGYALISQVHHGNAIGLRLRLASAQRTLVDPTRDIDLADGRKGATVHIDANSLVDAKGTKPSGLLTIDLSTYDPLRGDVPGDRGAVDAGSQVMMVHHVQAMSVDITDAAGERYNIAPGRRATVGFQAPAVASLPRTLTLSHYDEASGQWTEAGQATRRGARYLASVPSFSSWDLGKYAGNDTACIRLLVDDTEFERPFHLRVGIKPDQVHEEIVGDYTVTDPVNVIYGLPVNTEVALHVSPQSDPEHEIQVLTTNSGPLAFQSLPPYPYAGCFPVQLKTFLPTNTWLNRYGFGSEADAEKYYAEIGARPDKDTFKKWRDANGFQPGDSTTDVVFFNPNEIGLGRRANCHETLAGGVLPYVACYVTKFGHVGGPPDEMLDDTADSLNPGDTVALEFSPGPNAGPRFTKFYVYGPDGKLKTHTAFDPEGDIKHVPNVCLHCHGASDLGGGGNYDNGGDRNARFVTLDPQAYKFPASGPYMLDKQQERFREMNAMISYTFHHSGPGWDFMDSLYPQYVHNPGSKAAPAPLPAAWAGYDDIYFDIVKPSCRTCHMYQGDHWNFTQPLEIGTLLGVQEVCQGQMPNALSPMLRLWRTSDPHLPDLFANTVGGFHPFCGVENTLPDVHIVTPSNNANVGYGGLGMVHFEATASDAEDGPDCCSIKWTTDEGPMGYGRAIDYVFATPGDHVVTVWAVDKDGGRRSAAITVTAGNDPPTMTIIKPTAGQLLFPNVTYTFFGSSSDLNEPYLNLPCKNLLWISSKQGDPSGTGCQPQFTFNTLGPRTITLYGMDSDGAIGTATQTFTVGVPPANSPPVVVINQPGDGDVVQPDDLVTLSGTAIDPDGQVTPTVAWTAKVGAAPEVPLGNTPTISWTPSDQVPNACSFVQVVLRLYATDPDGTSSDAITVSVQYPAC